MDPPGKIELPSAFENADIDHLVILIADMLDRLIEHNDKIPLSPCPASISILDYLRRIVKYCNVERICLLIALHYVDQICARMPNFMISSLTCHRFIITAVVVSSKALCDAFCTNAHYAKVGGIRIGELNLLERELLAVLDWRLTSTREVLDAYYVNLIRTHGSGAYVLAEALETAAVAATASSPELELYSAESDMDSVYSASPAHVQEVVLPEEDLGSNTPSLAAQTRMQPRASEPSLSAIATRRKVEAGGNGRGNIGDSTISNSMEPSAVMIERATLSPKPVPRPTFEQNMAFAELSVSGPSTSEVVDNSLSTGTNRRTSGNRRISLSPPKPNGRMNRSPITTPTFAASESINTPLAADAALPFSHDNTLEYISKSPQSPFTKKRSAMGYAVDPDTLLGGSIEEPADNSTAIRPRTRPRIELES